MSDSKFRQIEHEADACVVGGGMAGLCAAIAAARGGAKVVLFQDRPVFGGNASSECRVHICGADVHNRNKNMRETGILEEIRLDNLRRNPNRNFSVWDTVLYEKVLLEKNITSLLNCSINAAEMSGRTIASVTGWQLTTQTLHRVRAKIFADCSGDGVLAPLTGAMFRMGREARSEYNESIAPEQADNLTMGMTVLFQGRLCETPQPFEPPPWALRFDRCEDIPYGRGGHGYFTMGYWWIELGGQDDAIHDAERLRDELLATTYGVWDHIKNRCPDCRQKAANWALEWMQFLPAKRESRRYVGAHVLNQNDIEAGGKFDDMVAYGGWSMDDHHPAGFRAVKVGGKPTIFHPAPCPYGIPYRCLYSRNIDNLMFAGRCHSATHSAMSSTRVMGTGCSMGQAVGAAAAMAAKMGLAPAGLLDHIDRLQQTLIRDDCYLPAVKQRFGPVTTSAELFASCGDPSALLDGVNRPVGQDEHAWHCPQGGHVGLKFAQPRRIETFSAILDSALHKIVQLSYHQPDDQLTAPPGELPRGLRLDVLEDGNWREHWRIADNHQRLLRMPVGKTIGGVRLTVEATWGDLPTRIFAIYVD
ncbi:MAG: FAD-dependent oxidoreductase [Planctomycetes bacterium]|nr:FAD-dependent oxidoreductase [Planctomycetota bacterium]